MQRRLSDSVGVIWPKPLEDIMEIVKRFTRELVNTGNVSEVWLFGSCATGNHTARSDVDLCIVIDDESDLTYSEISRIFYDITTELEGQFHIYKNSDFKKLIMMDNAFVREILKGINIVGLITNQDDNS